MSSDNDWDDDEGDESEPQHEDADQRKCPCGNPVRSMYYGHADVAQICQECADWLKSK